ncbi:MAG: DUF3048 domain-containing protein [bacterium]
MKTLSAKTQLILVITAACLIVGGYYFWFWPSQVVNRSCVNTDIKTTEIKSSCFRAVNGTQTTCGKENQPLVAVMVEDFLTSRPQSGLSSAQLVYEAPAEAYIPRFLALFDLSEGLPKIGPVRSSRPYYIDLAIEYQSLYVHSGGSPAALERLKTDKAVVDLNEFFGYNTDYFWRDATRQAPHNLYTSSANLAQAVVDYKMSSTSNFRSWLFKDEAPATSTFKMVKVWFSEADLNYQVGWEYDIEENNYWRYHGDEQHKDDTNTAIKAKNVLVQVVKTKILDEIGRKELDLSSGGKAYLFRDGQRIVGNWKKINNRTIFFDEFEKEVEFNRGNIWIELVPQYTKLSME